MLGEACGAAACPGGAVANECTVVKPFYCLEGGLLEMRASVCGCPDGFEPDGNACVPSFPRLPACLVPDVTAAYGGVVGERFYYYHLSQPPVGGRVAFECDLGNASSVVDAMPCDGVTGNCLASCRYGEGLAFTAAASSDGASCEGGVFLSPTGVKPGCAVTTPALAGVMQSVPAVVSYWGLDASFAAVDCGNGGESVSCGGGYCEASCRFPQEGAHRVSADVGGVECRPTVVFVGSGSRCEVEADAQLEAGVSAVRVNAVGFPQIAPEAVAVDCGGSAGNVVSCRGVGNFVYCDVECSFSGSSAGLVQLSASVGGTACREARVVVTPRQPDAPSCSLSVSGPVNPGEYAYVDVSYSDVGVVAGGGVEVDCGNGLKARASGCGDWDSYCSQPARCEYSVFQPPGVVALKVSSIANCTTPLVVGILQSDLTLNVFDARSGAAEGGATVTLFEKAGAPSTLLQEASGVTDASGSMLFEGLTGGKNMVVHASSGNKRGVGEFVLLGGSQRESVAVDFVDAAVVASARDSAGPVANALMSSTCAGIQLGSCLSPGLACGLPAFAGEVCRIGAAAARHADGFTDVVAADTSQPGVPATSALVSLFECGSLGKACCSGGDACHSDLSCSGGVCLDCGAGGCRGRGGDTLRLCVRNNAGELELTADKQELDLFVSDVLAADYFNVATCGELDNFDLLFGFDDVGGVPLSSCLRIEPGNIVSFKGSREGGACGFLAEEHSGTVLQARFRAALSSGLSEPVLVTLNIHSELLSGGASFISPRSLSGASNAQLFYAVNQRVFPFNSGALGALENGGVAFTALQSRDIKFGAERVQIDYSPFASVLWGAKSPVGGSAAYSCGEGDLLCCTGGWCHQAAVDSLAGGLKRSAKGAAAETVFYPRITPGGKSALETLFPGREFSYSTVAQVAQDVVLPNEVGVALAGARDALLFETGMADCFDPDRSSSQACSWPGLCTSTSVTGTVAAGAAVALADYCRCNNAPVNSFGIPVDASGTSIPDAGQAAAAGCASSGTLMEATCNSVGGSLKARYVPFACACSAGACPTATPAAVPAVTPAASATPAPGIVSCNDSDAGLQDLYSRSSVSTVDSSGTQAFEDYCFDVTNLAEKYCLAASGPEGTVIVDEKAVPCPNGCVNGACKMSSIATGTCLAVVPPAFSGTGWQPPQVSFKALAVGGALTGFLYSDGASIISSANPALPSANQLFNQVVASSRFEWPSFACKPPSGACSCAERFTSAGLLAFNPLVSCDASECVDAAGVGGGRPPSCQLAPAVVGASVSSSGARVFSQQGLSRECASFTPAGVSALRAGELYGALSSAWDSLPAGASLVRASDLSNVTVNDSLVGLIVSSPS